jgi:hypothetical protein
MGQDAKPGPSVAGTLSAPDLVKLLSGLGYETEKVNDTTSRIKIDRAKWSFKINVGVSSNAKKVWFTSYLADIPDIDKVPQAALAKLLQANLEFGPAHFVLSEGAAKPKKWLKLQYAIDNRNVTPAFIREELEYFVGQLQESAPVWELQKAARLTAPHGRAAAARRASAR